MYIQNEKIQNQKVILIAKEWRVVMPEDIVIYLKNNSKTVNENSLNNLEYRANLTVNKVRQCNA